MHIGKRIPCSESDTLFAFRFQDKEGNNSMVYYKILSLRFNMLVK